MHPRISINLISFPASTLAEDLAACRTLGARRIGVPIAKLEGAGWNAGVEAVRASGFGVSTVLHPFSFHLDERRDWEAQRAALIRSIDAARTLKAESVYMTSGRRGQLTWEEAAQAFVEASKPVAAYARESGVQLLIEQTSSLYVEFSFVHTLGDALRVADAAGIGVCVDLFACWTESSLKESLEAAMPRCSLVQVSDYRLGDRSLPNRSVPGDGAIPLERLLGWIAGAGYRGSFDLELIGPRIEREGPAQAIARAGERLAALFAPLGI